MPYDSVGILHDVDKCVRCRGCVVACKRRSDMTPQTTAEYASYGDSDTWGNTVSAQELMVVKSQADFDMGPMVRFSCWHCYTPPCEFECPFGAISKIKSDSPANGAVVTDYSKCQPDATVGGKTCTRQCVSACRGGGYPKIQEATGTGYSKQYAGQKKMMKCDMCFDRVDAGGVPQCVLTCPADALIFDTMPNILAYLNTHTPRYVHHTLGQRGQVIWASANGFFNTPKSDPYVEDHMSQAVDKLLRGPFARLAMVPAGLALGLYALQKRKETEEVGVG